MTRPPWVPLDHRQVRAPADLGDGVDRPTDSDAVSARNDDGAGKVDDGGWPHEIPRTSASLPIAITVPSARASTDTSGSPSPAITVPRTRSVWRWVTTAGYLLPEAARAGRPDAPSGRRTLRDIDRSARMLASPERE